MLDRASEPDENSSDIEVDVSGATRTADRSWDLQQ